MVHADRRRRPRGVVGLIAITLVAASCGPAPSMTPAALDAVVLRVPDHVLESWAMNQVRWSPDGSRLTVELQDQLVTSGRLVIIAAGGARIADLAGNEAAWVDDRTLLVRAYDPWRPDGSVLAITIRGDDPPERLILLQVPDLP